MATVRAKLREGTAVQLETRHFSWTGDEPIPSGGSDTGPDPYEALLGALGSCIAVTLRLYANHKGIDLSGVDVELEFDRVHVEDTADSHHPTNGRIERIQSRVKLYGSFDEAQRTRLAQVAQRCPVHKTLTNGLTIEDSVEFA